MSKISYQFDEHSCALSSLRTLAYLKTKKRGWKNIAFSAHPPYSLKTLEEEMSSFGFDLRFFESEKEKFSYPFEKEGPFLALLNEEEGIHMVVVTEIEKETVTYLDPAKGETHLKKESFLSLWSGLWGIMEQYHVSKPPKAKRIVPLWKEILSDAFLFVSEICLAFGLALLDKAPLWLSLTCLGLYLLLEEGRRIFILCSIRSFDKRYLLSVYDKDPNRLKINYERFNAFKKNLFADTASVVSKIGTIVLLSVIVGLNTPSFFISLGGVLALLCGEKLLFHRYFSLKGKRMRKEEGMLFQSEKEEEAKQLLFSLSKDADKYGKTMLLERGILTFVTAAFSLFPSLMSNEASLNFYLFHLFALLLIEKGGAEIFDYVFSKKEREMNELYFREYIFKPRD